MTTKYLTSNFYLGYDLKSNYSKLVIDHGVTVGNSSLSSYGVYATHVATIVNYGTVGYAGDTAGVFLDDGGKVTNGSATDTNAKIVGATGIVIANGLATVANFGTIPNGSSGEIGVEIYSGGTVTNGSTADKSAYILGAAGGVLCVGTMAATVTNFGTIGSDAGYAVLLGYPSDRLIIESGAVFKGNLDGGGGGTLELAGGADTITGGLGVFATMTGSGSVNVFDFDVYIVDAGAALTLTGANLLQSGDTLKVAGTLTNTGTLAGPTTSGYGVTLSGGQLTNGSPTEKTALISGDRTSVFGTAATTVTIANFGTIEALGSGDSVGVNLQASGSVTNGSAGDTTALITGGLGVYSLGTAATTVTNFGEIYGAAGDSVAFHAATDRLIVQNKADFVGAVVGGGGTLELASGTETITGLGGAGVLTGGASANFSGFATYVVDAGVTLSLTGTDNLTAGQKLTVAGTLANIGTLAGPSASGYGVTLAGGVLINGPASDTSALVTGFRSGVYVAPGLTATIANFGTIEALGPGKSVGVNLDATASVTNGSATDKTALIEGGYGVYSLYSTATVNNYGTIDGVGGVSVGFHVASDRLVVHSGSTLIGAAKGGGGTLDFDDGSGTITGLGGSGVFSVGASGSFSGFGTYDLYGGASWTLSGDGAIASTQTFVVGASSTLTVAAGTLALHGVIATTSTSVINLTSGAVIAGYSGVALDNFGTIDGAGTLYGPMSLTNSNFIYANAGAMVINNENGAGLTNNGAIESAAGDTLTLKDVSVFGGGAIDADGTVKLDAASITGGNLNVESGGVVQVASTISSIGSGVTVRNGGSIKVTSGAYLYLSANITGVGGISIDGVTGTNADLKAVGDVTLSGGGDVSMNVNGFITGYGSSHLTSYDVITGGGAIFGSMTVTNDGTIDDDAGAMLINNQNGGGLVNAGTLESTATGILSLKDVTVTGAGSITDDHQMKLATAVINGGTITVGSSALFEAIAGTSSLGSAVKLTNDKTVEVITGGVLTIAGAVTNNGLLETSGTGDLTVKGAITGTGSARLAGSGSLTIDGTDSQGVAIASTDTGNLVLGASSVFTGVINGLSKTGANAIDLQGVAYNASDTAKFSGTAAGGTLTILSSSNAVLATLTLKGNYVGKTFTLSNDGSGDTLVKDPPASGPLAQAIAGFGATSSSGAQEMPSPAAVQPLPLAIRG